MPEQVVEFLAANAAVEIVDDRWCLTDAPLFLENKARAYTKIGRTGAHGWGGPAWARLKAFEAAIALAGQRALIGESWSPDGEMSVGVVFEIGDRLVEVAPRNPLRRRHTRRMISTVRTNSIGADKAVQAVLDGLEGVLWRRDEQICDLQIIKLARAPGELGDRVRVIVCHYELGSTRWASPGGSAHSNVISTRGASVPGVKGASGPPPVPSPSVWS